MPASPFLTGAAERILFDQVYWTKKPAYAAPIGGRGNRLLAATYFGMTFVRVGETAALAYQRESGNPKTSAM